ncbi:MAG: Ger(x)C family spore germination protein [Bacillota bacterium]
MILKYCLILMQALFFLNMTGCWDALDISRRAIVSAICLDEVDEPGQILVGVQVIIPQNLISGQGQQSQGGAPFAHYLAHGATWIEAMRNIETQLTRSLFLEKTRVLIISQNLAAKGIADVVDFLSRSPQGRHRIRVVIAKEAPARRFLEIIHPLEKDTGSALDLLVTNQEIHSLTKPVSFQELMGCLSERNASPVIPMVGLSTDEKYFQAEGTGVFRYDRLVGWLNRKQTQTYLLLRNQARNVVLTVDAPKGPPKPVSLKLERSATSYQPVIQEGRLLMQIKIEAVFELTEQRTVIDLTKPEDLKALSERLAAQIKGDVHSLITTAQTEYQSDIFHFGSYFHRKYPGQWRQMKENWQEEFFPLVEAQAEAKVNIYRTGLTNRPF